MVAGVLNVDPHPFLVFLFLDLIHKVHKQVREKGGGGGSNQKCTAIVLVTLFFSKMCTTGKGGEGVGQIFGLFKHTYFIDGPIQEQLFFALCSLTIKL